MSREILLNISTGEKVARPKDGSFMKIFVILAEADLFGINDL
jgi:hypothetical protein